MFHTGSRKKGERAKMCIPTVGATLKELFPIYCFILSPTNNFVFPQHYSVCKISSTFIITRKVPVKTIVILAIIGCSTPVLLEDTSSDYCISSHP
jgi:hypothetical protein